MISFLFNNLRYPSRLLFLIPIIIILFIFIKVQLVKSPFQSETTKLVKKILRKYVFVSRTLIAILLVITFASPFTIKEKVFDRDPFVKILIDNSTSMDLFNTEFVPELTKDLEQLIGVEVKQFADGEKSALADGILQNVKNDENLLLITDGRNNKGSDLGDVVLFTKKLNATVNTINLKSENSDSAVTIQGPSVSMSDVENTYNVKLSHVGEIKDYNLLIEIDGIPIYDEVTSESYSFTKRLSKGFHTIKATIDAEDYFSENNVFYKTVKVVPKPKILFLSERSFPLYSFLLDLYDVEIANSIPEDMDDYYGVIVNNFPASNINMDVLVDYLTDGNGMAVIGGTDSYDLGEYKDSLFESLLPVFVAQPGKKEGDINIVILMDVSGSFKQQGSVSKSIAASVFRDIRNDIRIGAVAFADKSYLMAGIKPKLENKDLESKIARLDIKGDSGTNVAGALYNAINLLSKTSGSKNIIIITDGDPGNSLGGQSSAAARLAKAQGIKIYPVGIGNDIAEGRMKSWALATNGIYFHVEDAKRLKILFGDLEDQKNIEKRSVIILDENHFITQNVEPDIFITGYNQVVPRSIAKLLATTNTGDSLLTVWHYGLGRVASLATDDGTLWAGEMIQRDQSQLLTRTLNWVIGSPDRKSKDVVNVRDTRINVPTELTLRTETIPTSDEISFYKIEKDLYKSEITPTEVGFTKILGATFATNYPLEFESLGIDPGLQSIVSNSGGRSFNYDDTEGIIEFVKSRSKKIETARVDLRWPFIIAVIVLFLLEITIRRIFEHKKIYKGGSS